MGYDNITECFEHLKLAQESLNNIRMAYKDSPDMLMIYEPSAKSLVNEYKKTISEYVNSEVLQDDLSNQVDLWIRLQGKEFKDGRAPLGVVGTFLQKLVTANQHAITLLEQTKYQGGRFSKKIKELAEFDLIITAPGSLKLGLKKPDPIKFLEYEQDCQIDGQLMQLESAVECLRIAQIESEKSIEGIDLLARAMVAADDKIEFEKLKNDVNGLENMLKLLYYAREITPTQGSSIEQISIYGNKKINNANKKINITKETRLKLKELSANLIENESYIDASGTVRELDLDKLTFRIHNVKINNQKYNQIDCKINKDDFTEVQLENIINRQIKLTGILVLTTKGEIKTLKVDKIKFDESDECD